MLKDSLLVFSVADARKGLARGVADRRSWWMRLGEPLQGLAITFGFLRVNGLDERQLELPRSGIGGIDGMRAGERLIRSAADPVHRVPRQRSGGRAEERLQSRGHLACIGITVPAVFLEHAKDDRF